MKYIKYILFAGLVGTMSSCVSDLLDRQPTTEVSSDLFWKSTDDALSSTYGVYNAIRDLYATDYYYDGQGEFSKYPWQKYRKYHGMESCRLGNKRIFIYVEQCL